LKNLAGSEKDLESVSKYLGDIKMNITKRTTDGFCILNIEGRINTSNVHDFEKIVLEEVGSGETNFIFNCRGLQYISSSGLRVFLIAQKKVLEWKGKLFLCELRPSVLETVVMSGFTSIFEIFETEEEALQA
jgi:anti-sigma B factor antagonist